MEDEGLKVIFIACPNCGCEENIKHFVMYYGSLCLECDFDIKEYYEELRREKND